MKVLAVQISCDSFIFVNQFLIRNVLIISRLLGKSVSSKALDVMITIHFLTSVPNTKITPRNWRRLSPSIGVDSFIWVLQSTLVYSQANWCVHNNFSSVFYIPARLCLIIKLLFFIWIDVVYLEFVCYLRLQIVLFWCSWCTQTVWR